MWIAKGIAGGENLLGGAASAGAEDLGSRDEGAASWIVCISGIVCGYARGCEGRKERKKRPKTKNGNGVETVSKQDGEQ